MSRALLLLLGTAACQHPPRLEPLACDVGALGARADHPDAVRYQRLVDAALAHGSPAASVAVISVDGMWLGAGGVADLASDVPATPCHPFYVASTTKLFAASTTLRLVEQGVLALEDPARTHLPPEVVQRIPNLAGPSGATVRDLLHHSSGVPDYLTFGYFLDVFNGGHEPGTAAEDLAWIHGHRPEFPVGTDFEYSNANYLLLSLVLSGAAGAPAYDLVHTQVTEPLGLLHTRGRSEGPGDVVRGYLDLHGDGTLVDQTSLTEAVMGGAGKLDGGLVSTPHDLALLVRALAHDTLLTPASGTAMRTFEDYGPGEDDGPEDGYGLGLARIATRHGAAVGHYGTVHPYLTLAFHFPERDTTIVLTVNAYTGELADWMDSEGPFDVLFTEE